MGNKKLLLLGLLLVSCTSNSGSFNSGINQTKVAKQDIYYDVSYYFDYDIHLYLVFSDDNYETKLGECPAKNVFFITNYVSLPKNGVLEIKNEYCISKNELFVYNH